MLLTEFILWMYLPGKILRFKDLVLLAALRTCLGRQVIMCIFKGKNI